MKLNEIEAFWARFCDKCQDKRDCTFCYVTEFMTNLQIDWQLQEMGDIGGINCGIIRRKHTILWLRTKHFLNMTIWD